MDLAARPHITAGIALASAAILAAGPMAQHLPGLHAAQQLRQVSVADINLTDAASSMVDLFSGVENELASLASGASAAAVPAAALTDFINPAALPLPLATWVNTFQATGTNLQTTANLIQALPFPTLQQIAANWLSYADLYVKSYQTAANLLVNFYTGTQQAGFWGDLNTAFTYFASGNFYSFGLGGKGVVQSLYNAFFPIARVLPPLENILAIPRYFTQNLANVTDYLTTTGINDTASYLTVTMPGQIEQALGTSLQAASTAWSHGDPVGAISNLLNTPGVVTNAFLNGTNGTSSGLLDTLLNTNVLQALAPGLAKSITAPNAVNIATGGSLQGALQGFVTQLTNGWPSLSNAVSGISTGLTTLLQNVSSKMPSLLASFGATFATNIGLLISNLLKLL
ncbi:hypothetical protein H7H82_18265 [Mycobacterium heidelbergense]|uniref:hypothetical protein n=1 Tax=Mycobacterium heidelbergense TaxID=53376 RepID=UPI001154CA1C|nr:hypothetical protein [Mycobacterium heidelbergense]MCV7052512.1 hypothetical protein [Mycobacterium heidelbergense]BBZ49950.1 hypothetical protein MHEI_16670 [Mycobacterium heidelbergense]